MRVLSLIAVAAACALAGCGSVSGLDAKTSFSCKAPDGVLCESMSGIYANAQANNLPGQRVGRSGGASGDTSAEPQEADFELPAWHRGGPTVTTRPVGARDHRHGDPQGKGVVAKAPGKAPQTGAGVLTKPINSGTPIRSAPLVLRVWLAPWEDSDGDLHDQSYIYLPVDNGKWLIEHNRRRIQDAYRPVRAPAAQGARAAAGPQVGVKLTPREAAGDEERSPRSALQNAQDMVKGFLPPGSPGSPAQAGDTE